MYKAPSTWKAASIEELSTFITSGSRGWAAYYADSGSLFLRIGNLTREHINLRFDDAIFVRVPASSEGQRTRVEAGDILISITADLGIVGVVPRGLGDAYVNQHIALVRLHGDKVDSRWLGHYLASAAMQRQVRGLDDAGAKAGLNLSTVRQLRVLTPPLTEQRRIAEILDGLDEAILKTQHLIAKLKQVKQGLLHDLLTRGIDDNGEFRDSERHPEQFKDSTQGRVPIDWQLALLHEVAEVRSGIAKNEGRALQDPIDVHYLRVANVQDGFLDLRDMKTIRISRSDLDRYRVLPGDVLMNEGGDLDKLGRGSLWRGEYELCVHQNHVFVVRCGAMLLPEFLSVWTGTLRAKTYFMLAGKQTTNLASINKTQLGCLPVLIPSRAEQDRILSVLSSLEERLAFEGIELTKLEFLKQGLMEDLLTGRVRVNSLLGESAA